jgi:K+ transporter
MGIPSIMLVLLTDGSIAALIVMYSINVFLTFSLSQIGMCKFFWQQRKQIPHWLRYFLVNLIGFGLCFTILLITITEKFSSGGYVTLFFTTLAIIICCLIQNYYRKIKKTMKKLQATYQDVLPKNASLTTEPLNPKAMTAICVVHDFNGFSLSMFLSILNQFPKLYKNFVFISVAKVDSRSFISAEEIQHLEEARISALEKYVELARAKNFPATYYFKTGTNAAEATCELCLEASNAFPKSTVFVGLLQLKREFFYHKILHSTFPYDVEHCLQSNGVTTVVLPIKTDL